ncbi:MAG: hypothetical protein UX31_C0003G0027 [Candidatus Nomurabacteria bacterium GW2011_GWA1_46_11]|uniref:Uncharacterized protein n=1 Tax=Candidatus Nomurabacteria bacterium GW2011_GWA1_46_11 TaxID=1618732 RepID=A0A0G1NPK8_9BACT|nr:MAG: hypothetical protein UW69_C0026G0004 [Microgenomates group bacterium GW2011_GWA2_44_7]KKT78303.1 MAG: hypothetical protein UW73_C0004G0027 [Microgenomates group bacterium GW2011_GWB1_44_8]KKU22361.1 MAG: hypothetical protein UX31_C0003G0027 [Candidatus Nomurabacteria bacterium GW2011_GWA1_46_11]
MDYLAGLFALVISFFISAYHNLPMSKPDFSFKPVTASPTLSNTPLSSPTSTPSVRPATTPTPNSIDLSDFRYPGGKIIQDESKSMVLETTDDYGKVSKWYQEKVNNLGTNTKVSSWSNLSVEASENTDITTNIKLSADSGNNNANNGEINTGKASVSVNSQSTTQSDSTGRLVTTIKSQTQIGQITISLIKHNNLTQVTLTVS